MISRTALPNAAGAGRPSTPRYAAWKRAAASALAVAALASTVLCLPARAQVAVTESSLPNGMSILVLPRHAVAIAAIDVWVRAGTRRQAPGQEGVAHYLEHLLFTGTTTRPSETDIDGAIEDLGGSLDAGTSYDWAHFYTVVPSASFEPALGVVSDALEHATLSQSSVESERPIIVSEIQRNSDDPATYAAQQTRASLFGPSNPYGQPITGTTEQAAAVQRDQILDFYHKYYVPSNVTLVVTGDVTPDQVQHAAEQWFGGWKGASAAAEQPLEQAPPPEQPVRKTVNRPSDQTYVVFGWRAPSVHDQPDVWTMDVLLTYLGQGGRNVLDDDLHRSKRLVTSVSADFLTQQDPGILTITLALPTANLGAAAAGVLDHVRALRDAPLAEDQLAEAKQQLIASYLFDTQTVSGKADSLGFYSMIDTYQYDETYIQHINSVTAAQVQQVAQRYLRLDQYAETILAPPQDPENAAVSRQPFGAGEPGGFNHVALATPARSGQ